MSADSTETRIDTALRSLFYHTDRVRFVDWRAVSGAKTAIYLTGVVAIIAFLTGLSNLSQEALVLDGPLAHYVPTPIGIVQYGGILTAFVLGLVTFGLKRHKRVAWYGAVTVLPIATVLPLTSLHTTDIPLLISILVTIPLLVRNRNKFDRALDLSPLQIASLSSIAGVLAYGTIGSYALREQFVEIHTWSDGVYFVIVSIATVGYGDITPVTTEAKWFSLSVIIFGTGAFTAALGALIIPAIERRMAAAVGNMTISELQFLEDHVVVLGYSDITAALLETLTDEVDVVVVTEDQDQAALLRSDDVNVLTDDPTDVETLDDARIETARGVVAATDDDARDVLAVIAAKQVNPDVHIVASANDQQHVDKLELVGADTVVSPTRLVGKLLGQSVLDESTDAFDKAGTAESSDSNQSDDTTTADSDEKPEHE